MSFYVDLHDIDDDGDDDDDDDDADDDDDDDDHDDDHDDDDDNDVENYLKIMFCNEYSLISMGLLTLMSHLILLNKRREYCLMVQDYLTVNVSNLSSRVTVKVMFLCNVVLYQNVDGNPSEIGEFQSTYPNVEKDRSKCIIKSMSLKL